MEYSSSTVNSFGSIGTVVEAARSRFRQHRLQQRFSSELAKLINNKLNTMQRKNPSQAAMFVKYSSVN